MLLAIIISFILGGLVGAMCMGLAVASGEQSRAEERQEEPEVSVNPCTSCRKLCEGRGKQKCCDWCKWIHDYSPPCETCDMK